MKAFLTAVAFSAATLVAPIEANAATYTYVGSWEVDDGPLWTSMPQAYSGTEAAALLFGGAASDYVISTISDLVSDINFMAWYSLLGVSGGHELPQDLDQALAGGLYYDGSGYNYQDMSNPASAYVWDNATGSHYTNYAFVVSAVPVPAAGILLMGALGGLAAVRRRKTLA